MAWDKTKPENNGLIINHPGQLRANWEAIEARVQTALMVTNTMCSNSMALANSKLAQIITAEKVSGSALYNLGSIPSSAGNIPLANLTNAIKSFEDQTITDVKTFSSFPITPSAEPSEDYQVANKKYVDDKAFYVGAIESTDAHQVGGTGATLTRNVWYQASCDGEVAAIMQDQSDDSANIYVYLGSSTISYTLIARTRCNANISTGFAGISFPVMSGKYWQFGGGTAGIASYVFFTPLQVV